MTKLYYEFRERNSHEGETWVFFIVATEHNKKMLDEYAKYNSANNLGYSIEAEKTKPEEEVDLLVENAREGYMPSHQKFDRSLLKMSDLIKIAANGAEDPFYKGNVI